MFKIRNFVIKFSFSKHRFHFINLHNFFVLQMSIFKIYMYIYFCYNYGYPEILERPPNTLNPSDSVTSKLIFIEFEFLLMHLQIPTIIA